MAPSLPPSVSPVKFVDGEWVLDEPQFILAIFLDVTALECQLPLEDSGTPAGLDLETVTNRPLARWQIKVSRISNHFCNAHCIIHSTFLIDTRLLLSQVFFFQLLFRSFLSLLFDFLHS